jgi:hypothetical protein
MSPVDIPAKVMSRIKAEEGKVLKRIRKDAFDPNASFKKRATSIPPCQSLPSLGPTKGNECKS